MFVPLLKESERVAEEKSRHMNKYEVVSEILHVLDLSNKFKHALEYRLQISRQIRDKLNNGQQCQELLESIGQ